MSSTPPTSDRLCGNQWDTGDGEVVQYRRRASVRELGDSPIDIFDNHSSSRVLLHEFEAKLGSKCKDR